MAGTLDEARHHTLSVSRPNRPQAENLPVFRVVRELARVADTSVGSGDKVSRKRKVEEVIHVPEADEMAQSSQYTNTGGLCR